MWSDPCDLISEWNSIAVVGGDSFSIESTVTGCGRSGPIPALGYLNPRSRGSSSFAEEQVAIAVHEQLADQMTT